MSHSIVQSMQFEVLDRLVGKYLDLMESCNFGREEVTRGGVIYRLAYGKFGDIGEIKIYKRDDTSSDLYLTELIPFHGLDFTLGEAIRILEATPIEERKQRAVYFQEGLIFAYLVRALFKNIENELCSNSQESELLQTVCPHCVEELVEPLESRYIITAADRASLWAVRKSNKPWIVDDNEPGSKLLGAKHGLSYHPLKVISQG